jgi:hypothetical protein
VTRPAVRYGSSLTNQKFWFAAMRQKVEHDTQRTETAQAVPKSSIEPHKCRDSTQLAANGGAR